VNLSATPDFGTSGGDSAPPEENNRETPTFIYLPNNKPPDLAISPLLRKIVNPGDFNEHMSSYSANAWQLFDPLQHIAT